MFESFKGKFRKRSVGSTAVVEMARFMEGMFSAQELEERHVGIRGLKKLGSSAVEEFKTDMLKGTVLQIVQDDKPLHSLYKSLFSTIESLCIHKAVFSEKFSPNRQVIYDHFNKKKDDPSLRWTDEMVAQVAIWEECELFCLAYLQRVIAKVEKENWWKDYMQLYELYVKQLLDGIVRQAEGKDPLATAFLIGPMQKEAERFKAQILGEASQVKY